MPGGRSHATIAGLTTTTCILEYFSTCITASRPSTRQARTLQLHCWNIGQHNLPVYRYRLSGHASSMVASPARPTSLSRQISHTTTASSDKDNIAYATEWTEEQERRLLYCQSELKGAQRRWSESQELWIEEVCSAQHNPGWKFGSIDLGLTSPVQYSDVFPQPGRTPHRTQKSTAQSAEEGIETAGSGPRRDCDGKKEGLQPIETFEQSQYGY
jgi:hypothetical protein